MIYDSSIDKDYKKYAEDATKEFDLRYNKSIIRGNSKFTTQKINKESMHVRKAKLILYKYFKDKGYYLFNEISCREGKSQSAPVLDLYEFKNKIGIEIHWKHKKINHLEMIPRILNYKRLFGECYLVLLSWGKGNGWKPSEGFTALAPLTIERYTKAGIKVVLFNIDYPKFDWLNL